MDDRTRRRLGWLGIAVGAAILLFGVLAVHFTALDAEDSLGRELYPAIPRGWQWVLLAQIIAFTGSQIAIGGLVVGWLWQRPMTWALATVGAFVVTLQVILYFGVVPNEWLGLTQGEFEWTSQNIWFTVPNWLVLNNELTVSYAVVKDVVNAGYNTTLLAAALVGAYKWQEYKKRGPAAKPQVVSTYGRPIVKGNG